MKYIVLLQDWKPQHVSLVLFTTSSTFTIFLSSYGLPYISIICQLFFLASVFGTTSNRIAWLYIVPLSCFSTIFCFDKHISEILTKGAYSLSLLMTFFISNSLFCAFVTQKTIWEKQQNLQLHALWCPLAFPAINTGIFQLLHRYSSIGASEESMMSFAFDPYLQQSASIFGQIGLVFLGSWISSVGAGILIGRIQNRHKLILASILSILLIYGGIRVASSKDMFPSSIENWSYALATPLQMSCIVEPAAINEMYDNNYALKNMIDRTNLRLSEGDDLIVWSEAAVFGRVSPDAFKWSNITNPGAVVAVTFQEYSKEYLLKYNIIELFQNGKSIKKYYKNLPSPIAETGVTSGKYPPNSTEIVFTPRKNEGSDERTQVTLNVTVAVSFAFDFPYLMRASQNADLAIDPAYYRESGVRVFKGNDVYRTIENGFTMFKCAAYGISGAVDPYGATIAAKPTFLDDTFTEEVPVQRHIKTIYASGGGYLFGYTSLLLAPIFIFIAIYAPMVEDDGSGAYNEISSHDGQEDFFHNGAEGELEDLLFCAAEENDVLQVQRLINSGVNTYYADRIDGKTALHIAANNCANEAIKVLLNSGVYVNAEDYNGTSALHLAVIADHLETCELLIQHGADSDQPDSEGETPKSYASESNSQEMRDYFAELL